MNVKGRLEAIEKAVSFKGIPDNEKLQVIKGSSIKGKFVPDDPQDTIENREATLIAKHGTAAGAVFVNLIDRFEA